MTRRPNLMALAAQDFNTALTTLAEEELSSRTEPIQGEVQGANAEGGVSVATPSGGQIQADRLSDGPFDRRVPVQRGQGAQRTFVDTPPAGTDLAAVWAAIEALRAELLQYFGATVSDRAPTEADALFDGQLWLETGLPPGISAATKRLWVWEASTSQWHGLYRHYRGSGAPSFVEGAVDGDHATDLAADPLALYLFSGNSWSSP